MRTENGEEQERRRKREYARKRRKRENVRVKHINRLQATDSATRLIQLDAISRDPHICPKAEKP